MSLEDAIASAIATSSPPPHNEAATCHWIIYPLLLACGYLPQEIVPEMGDNHGQFPDYTILPTEDCRWYMEAKAWNVALQDAHAQQAMTYAFHNGKRWVVLSNGRFWRLYDSSIQGLASDRFVMEAALAEVDSLIPLLKALNKGSVRAGGVERFASRARLHCVLSHQLENDQSNVVKAIWKVLKAQPGLTATTRNDIVCYFSNSGEIAHTTSAAYSQPSAATDIPPTPRSVGVSAPIIDTIDQLLAGGSAAIDYQTPIRIQFPDASAAGTDNWRDVAVQMAGWFDRQGKVPQLPFVGLDAKHSNRYFVNSVPQNPSGPMRSSRAVNWGSQTVYLELHRSAHELLKCLHSLCVELGVPGAGFAVTLKPWGKRAKS